MNVIHHSHTFDFEKIIGRNNNHSKRMLLEELCIEFSNKCVNIKSKVANNISNMYLPLFHRLSQNQ